MDRIGGVSPTRSVVFLCAMQSREFSFSRLWMDAGLRPSALVGIDWDRNNPARSRENIAANRAEIPEGTWINQELGKALDSLVGKDGLIDAQCVDNDTWSLPTSRDALANSVKAMRLMKPPCLFTASFILHGRNGHYFDGFPGEERVRGRGYLEFPERLKVSMGHDLDPWEGPFVGRYIQDRSNIPMITYSYLRTQ